MSVNLYDVAWLKAQQTSYENFPTLEKICQDVVYRHSRKLINKFHMLPKPILSALEDRMVKAGSMKMPKSILEILHQRPEFLIMNLPDPDEYTGDIDQEWGDSNEFIDILKLVGSHCQTSMKRLEIKKLHGFLINWEKMPLSVTTQLNETLSSLPNLTHLDLTACFIKNNTVAVVVSTCTQLRHLGVAENEKVTNEAVDMICEAQLENLTSVNIWGTNVTEKGVVALLVHYPEIENVHHESTDYVILKYENLLGEREVKLKVILINDQNNEKMSIIRRRLPHLKNITVKGKTDGYFRTPIQISYLFEQYSLKLREITIDGESLGLDVSVVGYKCLNLEVMMLINFADSKEPQYELDSRHFSNLKKVVIYMKTNTNILKAILSSPVLKYMNINSELLTEDIVRWLVTMAKTEKIVFSRIERLNLRGYESVDRIKQIVCVSPKLNYICIGYWEHRKLLWDFMFENKLKITLD